MNSSVEPRQQRRQVAVLEGAAGVPLFERCVTGGRLTTAGGVLLRYASIALDEVDRAAELLHGAADDRSVVRLGVFASAGPALLPGVLDLMRSHAPSVDVITREGSTPSLAAGLRAGTLDVAVVGSQPPHAAPDDQDPPLELTVLAEGALLVAVPADSSIGTVGTVTPEELSEVEWVAGPYTAREPAFGTWPGLQSRPKVRHRAWDWLTKLTLVAGGHGVTTVPPYLAKSIPDTIRLVRVTGGEPVLRRASIARLPGPRSDAVSRLCACLHETAADPVTGNADRR